MTAAPLQPPARYVAPFAVSFANVNGDSDVVSSINPLPVSTAPSTPPAPLAGSASTSGVFGPFLAVLGRPVMLALSGTWAGQVRLLRSTDGGATKLPLTALGAAYGSYTANLGEPVWEEGEAGVRLYLDATLTSGSLTYRMGQ